jgi:hypothetical protein
MGLYSSPSPPPPPPDYTKEKDEFASAEAARRQQQADAYNAQVTAFNNALSGYGGQISDWSGKVGGLGLTNDELFSGYLGNLNTLQNQLYGLNFNFAKPVFESMVYSPWGSVSVDAPALLNLNTGLKDNYINQLGSLSQKINGLQQQRMSEEQKFAQQAGNIYSQLQGVNTALSNAKIGDLSGLNNYKTQIDALQAQKNAFTSPIMGDYNPFAWSQVDPTYQQALERFNSLMAQRQAEIDRVKAYEQSIVDRAGTFRNTYGGLNIGNEAGMNELQTALDSYQREVGRFTTQLNSSYYDLSQEIGDVQSVEDLLGELRAKRVSELSRVNDAQEQYQNLALQLASAARTSDIYNSGRLSDLQAQIAALTGQIDDFSSELPTDFGLATNQLSTAQGLLEQLLAQRGTTLDQLRGRMEGATTGIGNIADYDEAAMNQALTRLMGLQNQFTPFMGADVDPQKLQLQNSVTDINNMLANLANRRSGFETEAQTFLNQLNNGSFTSLSMLDPLFTQANDLQTQARQYQAMQAYDELTKIMEKLNSEKSRLTSDEQNAAAQRLLDQQNALAGGTSLNDIMNQISPEQYAQLMSLAQRGQQGDQNALDQYNAFLRSLGVGV